ncbi:MAG: polysaccharide biosynthesis C-terminal domain-containing protein, partial [Chloroflexi bacterium]|nr:polysaccharide biosynthesis C-terminal domain-containing protein [Chloroflexota bacterium]
VVAGSIAYALLQLPPLLRTGFTYEWTLNWQNIHFRRVLKMLVPRTLTLSLNQLGSTVTTRTLASAIAGGVAALNYSYTLLLLPVNILGVAVSTAAFPTLSELSGQRNFTLLRDTVGRALDTLIYLGMGTGAVLAALSGSVVSLIYQRGAFSSADTALTAGALVCYAWGLAAQLGDELLPRALFALKDARTPLLINIVVVLINIVLSFVLLKHFGIAGIAAALSFAATVEFFLLLITLNRRIPGLLSMSLLQSYGKLAGAALIAWLITSLMTRITSQAPGPQLVHILIVLCVSGSTGLVTYAVAGALFGSKEHERLLERLRGRKQQDAARAPSRR